MLRLFITLVCLLTTPTLAATCGQVGEMAQVIMSHRQTDGSMSVMMGRIDDMSHLPEESKDVLRDFVIRAYAAPSYLTEGSKITAVIQFRNQVELECYQLIQAIGRQ
jgi:hypothetical protein